MLRKSRVLLIIVVLVAVAVPALAGGWVVITLDSLPGEIRAGETLSVGFMVRQHGQTPTNEVSPHLTATNSATGETVEAGATQSGETGHFTVEVVFPSEGQWEWSIAAAPFAHEGKLAPLTVLPAVAANAEAASSPAALPVREMMRWSALVLLAAAAATAVVGLKRRQVAPARAAGD